MRMPNPIPVLVLGGLLALSGPASAQTEQAPDAPAASAGTAEKSTCVAPETPAIPNGRRVDEKAMREAHARVTEFLAASERYRACLEDTLRDVERAGDPKVVEVLNEMIVEALETDQLVADTFNRELRAFRARHRDSEP
ncbi:MAG: hypothetical protein KatS3mg121_1267 [Gammaproteobacteria bacterium]|nr:MAG: hypothetical protein KatS3mg121_1267 [Gammaproteobacteria bacterium]